MAEELPETEFYVEWKDADKSLAGLVLPGSQDSAGRGAPLHGLTRVKVQGQLARQVQVGACYRGRRAEDGSIVGRVEPCPEAPIAAQVMRNFTGELDLIRDFAFVRSAMGSIWVSPPALHELGKGHELAQGQRVKGSCRRVVHKDRRTGREAWEWELLHVEVDEREPIRSFAGSFSGTLAVSPKGFGFADDCFVPPALIQQAGLKDGDHVTGEARRTWNKRRGEWGWTAASIGREEE